jgi:hypothetical protein
MLAWITLVYVVGCAPATKTGHLSGKVELDGKPLDNASITFKPVDGKSPTAGATVKAGLYSADVPVGKMKVVINQGKVVGKKKAYNTPDSPEVPITQEALPAKYNTKTELEFDVQPGKNEKDFILSSK